MSDGSIAVMVSCVVAAVAAVAVVAVVAAVDVAVAAKGEVVFLSSRISLLASVTCPSR